MRLLQTATGIMTLSTDNARLAVVVALARVRLSHALWDSDVFLNQSNASHGLVSNTDVNQPGVVVEEILARPTLALGTSDVSPTTSTASEHLALNTRASLVWEVVEEVAVGQTRSGKLAAVLPVGRIHVKTLGLGLLRFALRIVAQDANADRVTNATTTDSVFWPVTSWDDLTLLKKVSF